MQSSAYPLKLADVRKLIVAAPNFRDSCVVKTLFWFGLRREELVELDIRDIDFERRRITVRMGKGEKTRVIPSKLLITAVLSNSPSRRGPKKICCWTCQPRKRC